VVLALFPPIASLSQARKLARKGRIRVNDVVAGPMDPVRPGDRLAVDLPDEVGPTIELDLPLVYADDHMAIVDKPAGLVTSGARRRTLQAALSFLLPRSPLPDAMARPHPVHRLDARTRGLVACARTHSANVALGHAFQDRQVDKRYRALLVGALEGEGVIETSIDGRPARTRWRCVQVTPAPVTGALSTVDLWPETGRTHQLRIHMASLGHPVLGDDAYTTAGPVLRGQGLYLAAVSLRLPHPATGEELLVEIPEPVKWARFRAWAEGRAGRQEEGEGLKDEAAVEAMRHGAPRRSTGGTREPRGSSATRAPGHRP